MNKFLRNVGFYLLIILVAISIIDYFSTKNTTKQEVEYTKFLQQVVQLFHHIRVQAFQL